MTPFESVKINDTVYGCNIQGVCGKDLQDFCAELKLLLLKYGITNIQTSISTLAQISIIDGKLLILDTYIKGSGKIANPQPGKCKNCNTPLSDQEIKIYGDICWYCRTSNSSNVGIDPGYKLDA